MAGEASNEQDAEQGLPSPRKRKSVEWRRDPDILARLVKVERLHLKRLPNTAIADTLNVDEKTIRRDIERLRELWLERTSGQVGELRAQKVAELQDIYLRSLDAAEWDAFCERAVLFDDPSMPDYELERMGLPAGLRVSRDEKGSATFRGNKAAALAQARQAVMDQAKVLGLIVDKVAPTNGNGSDLDLATLLRLAREQREGTNGDSGTH